MSHAKGFFSILLELLIEDCQKVGVGHKQLCTLANLAKRELSNIFYFAILRTYVKHMKKSFEVGPLDVKHSNFTCNTMKFHNYLLTNLCAHTLFQLKCTLLTQ